MPGFFKRLRSADELKSDMKANIDKRKDDSFIGRAIGSAYDSLVGAFQDISRRLIENPWYGKDILTAAGLWTPRGRSVCRAWTATTILAPRSMDGISRNPPRTRTRIRARIKAMMKARA